MTQQGTIKWYNDAKGYGFISTGQGPDIFVHQSSITAGGFMTLTEGDSVSFDVVESPKGPVAVNVARIPDIL